MTRPLILTHDDCVRHENGHLHPESPDRLIALQNMVARPDFNAVTKRQAPRATVEQITRAHSEAYLKTVLEKNPTDDNPAPQALGNDIILTRYSSDAAFCAAGAAVAGVDAILSDEADRVFCAIRPPGHHAHPDHGAGFCIFNNVFIAATHARDFYGIEKIAIVDFDVHHGDGTEAMTRVNGDGILFLSSHEYGISPMRGIPFYPMTGNPKSNIPGHVVNGALEPLSTPEDFMALWNNTLFPELEKFGPELILVSAGFDAYAGDPLADLCLQPHHYEWIGQRLSDLASQHSRGRALAVLEGGYDIDGLVKCTDAFLKPFLGLTPS